MPKSRFTIAFFLSFLITTGVLAWWQVPAYPLIIWELFFAGIMIFLLMGVFFSLRLRSTFAFFCFFSMSLLFGTACAFLRVAQTTHVTAETSVESFAIARSSEDRWTEFPSSILHGWIVEEPDRRPLTTKYTVAVDTINNHRVTGRVLVTDHAMDPRHAYGDEVLVTGVLEKPQQIETFAYDRYLSRYDIYSVMYRGSVLTVSSGHGNVFFAYLFTLKEAFESQLNRLYPEPHASFMAGLLTGSRKGIPEHLLQAFQATGLTHIIAISGYNITIVISVIAGMLFFIPLRFRLIPSVAAIVAFTFFVGASPAVVRAAIMGCLGLLALHTGRQQHMLITLLCTAALMVFWNPKVLWYDAGFQLSFLSVLGLVYLAPFLERLSVWLPSTLGIRESFQMTMAAQLAAVPLTILLFGQFSLVAPIANIVVAPLIPLAMLFGFLGTSVAFFSKPLGLLIAYPGWGALELIIRVTKFFASVPSSFLHVPHVRPAWVWGYYFLLICLIVWMQWWRGGWNCEKPDHSCDATEPTRP